MSLPKAFIKSRKTMKPNMKMKSVMRMPTRKKLRPEIRLIARVAESRIMETIENRITIINSI
jgi:hypothetical protein